MPWYFNVIRKLKIGACFLPQTAQTPWTFGDPGCFLKLAFNVFFLPVVV
jgi:hypothetical protein